MLISYKKKHPIHLYVWDVFLDWEKENYLIKLTLMELDPLIMIT